MLLFFNVFASGQNRDEQLGSGSDFFKQPSIEFRI